MATVNKDFRVKQGIVVESGEVRLNGATSGQTLIKPSSTASGTITFPATTGTVVTTGDTGTVTNTMLAGSIANDKLSNSSVTINGYTINLGGSATYSTDNINEGTTNLYYTNERAQDAIGTLIQNGTQTNISVTYDDANAALNFNATGGVASLSGTANEVEVTSSGTAYTVGLPNDITIAGNITINGTPTNAAHAVTKGYVDNAVAGLDWHSAVNLLATSNVALTGSSGTLIIDGHAALDNTDTGYRLLLKGQSTGSENGIYTYSDNGTSYTLTRASDADTYQELIGAAVFVLEGNLYASTAWLQTDHYLTSFAGQDWIQFSGAGTYTDGNGLDLIGNVFSIDTAVTVDVSTAQTLTNKTLTSPTINNPVVAGLYLSDNNIVIEGTPDTFETTLTFTNPTDDRTITFKDASGTVAFTSDVESAIDSFGSAVSAGSGISVGYNTGTNVLTVTNTDLGSSQNIFKNIAVGATTVVADSNNDTLTFTAGTGITLTANATSDTIDIANAGVTSLAGTADQVSVTASTGSVTLSLPQSIATTSSPTFAAITSGSVTLTDALIGTATQSLTDGTATVVDSWSVASYSSAKYLVQMKKNDDIEIIEVLVTVDGNNNVYLTEYADVISNTQLGTTDADFSSGNVRLLVTASNGTTVKVHKTLIEA